MEKWFTQFTATVIGLFFVFSWGYYAIRINKLEKDIEKLKQKINNCEK